MDVWRASDARRSSSSRKSNEASRRSTIFKAIKYVIFGFMLIHLLVMIYGLGKSALSSASMLPDFSMSSIPSYPTPNNPLSRSTPSPDRNYNRDGSNGQNPSSSSGSSGGSSTEYEAVDMSSYPSQLKAGEDQVMKDGKNQKQQQQKRRSGDDRSQASSGKISSVADPSSVIVERILVIVTIVVDILITVIALYGIWSENSKIVMVAALTSLIGLILFCIGYNNLSAFGVAFELLFFVVCLVYVVSLKMVRDKIDNEDHP